MFGMQRSSPSEEYYGYSDHHHHENATASCISGFFRRLLCKNLPTVQPPDYDYEDSSRTESSPPRDEGAEEVMKLSFGDVGAEEVVTGPSPNIVARLMGLESMPEFDWMPRTPESFGRSRSANSYLSWFDADPIDLHKGHRRLKTTSSFREIPTFLKQENEDFLLLSFDLDHDMQSSKRECKKKVSETSKSSKEKSNKGVLQIKKKKCDSETVSSRKKISEPKLKDKQSRLKRSDAQLSVLRQQPCQPSPKCSKVSSRKEKIGVVVEKKAESDSSSENSSPVSVLDPPFEAESKLQTPDHILRRKPVDSGKKEAVGELRTEQKTSEDHKVVNDTRLLKTGLNLANEEILRNLNWVSRDWCDESEEIVVEIELQIMESLLCSIADELSTVVFNL